MQNSKDSETPRMRGVNHRRLCLQWAHEHGAWQDDWHQKLFFEINYSLVSGTMIITFVLGAMLVNAAFQSAL